MKKEGGIETLLFGPSAARSSRKASVSGGKADKGKGETEGGEIKKDHQPTTSSAFADSVMRPTRSGDDNVKKSGSGPGQGPGPGQGKDAMKSVDSEDDVVLVVSDDALPAPAAVTTAATAATAGLGTTSGSPGSGSSLFPRVDSASDPSGAETDHSYSYALADRGPFRESRKAVHFSESLEDNWEEVCVDVTPFTIKATLEEDEDDDEEAGFQPAFLSAGSDFTRSPLRDSFVARQSDYVEAQRKADALVRISDDDDESDPPPASANATPEAELEFLESISASLSAADSPLESESEKVTDPAAISIMSYLLQHLYCSILFLTQISN